jgi:hypothetical protein
MGERCVMLVSEPSRVYSANWFDGRAIARSRRSASAGDVLRTSQRFGIHFETEETQCLPKATRSSGAWITDWKVAALGSQHKMGRSNLLLQLGSFRPARPSSPRLCGPFHALLYHTGFHKQQQHHNEKKEKPRYRGDEDVSVV